MMKRIFVLFLMVSSFAAAEAPYRVHVKSPATWTCFIGPEDAMKPAIPVPAANPGCTPLPSTSKADLTHLILQSTDGTQIQVPLPIAPNPAPSSLAKLLSLAALFLSFASLVLGIMLFQSSRRSVENAERFDGDLTQKSLNLKQTVDRISTTLDFQAMPGSKNQASYPVEGAKVRREPAISDRFLEALTEWSILMTPAPSGLAASRGKIERSGAAIHPSDFQQLSQDIVELAINTTDESFDSSPQHQPQQRALSALIESAGLTVITPQQGDTYDSSRHQITLQRHATSPQYRGKIAGFLRRGFERSGKVIKKAEVSLFD